LPGLGSTRRFPSCAASGELQAGVRLADDPGLRNLRQARLSSVRAAFEPIAVDEPIAYQYGELLAFARSHGRSSEATDLLIVATAAATGRTLVTFDAQQASLAHAAGVSGRRLNHPSLKPFERASAPRSPA
jgi:tRNA(fMet)-specific endonuclease VapC